MDYEAIDREFSSYLVTCGLGKARFYLTPERTATDMIERADRFRYHDEAEVVASEQRAERAWAGYFDWQPVSVPAAKTGRFPSHIAAHAEVK